jgi:hypothetical protein
MPDNPTRPQDAKTEGQAPSPSRVNDDAGLAPEFARSQPPASHSMRAPPPEAAPRRTGHERLLARRMQTAAGMFWGWLVVGMGVAVIGVPTGNDAGAMAALDEGTRFASAFDRASLERGLRSHATAQHGVPLAKVAQRISGRGVPKTSAAPTAAPIAPYSLLELDTLGQVHALAAPGATLSIETPRPESIGEALSWRLTRSANREPHLLQAVVLTDLSCTSTDLDREREIGRLQGELSQARSRAESAEQRQGAAERAYEARRKHRAPWKVIAKANETRAEARKSLEEAQRLLLAAATRYETVASEALRLAGESGTKPRFSRASATKQRRKPSDADEVSCRVATATLQPKSGTTPLEFSVPARVDRRDMPVPQIAGAGFEAAKRFGFWNDIKDSAPPVAVAQLRGRFSWHYRYAELAGIKLGGMTVLQLAPLALVAMLLLVIRSCRRVSATYNPFDSPVFTSLPMVGFSTRWANLLALIGLPVVACGLSAWSLLQIAHVPVGPALSGVACLALGGLAFVALRRLLDLREAIMQSHTIPPPGKR